MPTFQSKPFRSSAWESTVAAKYRRHLKRHPFALFGLPFILTMLAGAFFLTPAQALRYERHDRKVRKVKRRELFLYRVYVNVNFVNGLTFPKI
ncbi:Cytochrome oxidase assembly, variant 2 [Orbilia ellipsospora]|uniref:Cytochrome c oxidase assembly protein COX16, mitochondrial n=1 Tax=Orbilia ellipsospora TaxID=2528407 RepID=A0AAV9XMI8_9PEZI